MSDKIGQFGTVKWFDSAKGYGFIVPDDKYGMDVFLHARQLETVGIDPKGIGQGTRLRYVVTTDRGGKMQASDIERVTAA